MGTIFDLQRGLNKLKLRSAIPKIIERDSDYILDLNKSQLQKGVTSEGITVSPDYALFTYALDKHMMNPEAGFGNPDLKLTGAFYRAFYLTAGYTWIFTIDSLDSKSAMLERKYSKYIFGLTKENLILYSTGLFYENLKKYITQTTGLIFR